MVVQDCVVVLDPAMRGKRRRRHAEYDPTRMAFRRQPPGERERIEQAIARDRIEPPCLPEDP